jgi:hypothetical protein
MGEVDLIEFLADDLVTRIDLGGLATREKLQRGLVLTFTLHHNTVIEVLPDRDGTRFELVEALLMRLPLF